MEDEMKSNKLKRVPTKKFNEEKEKTQSLRRLALSLAVMAKSRTPLKTADEFYQYIIKGDKNG